MNALIEPGSVIGVLGSGQLGRMFAIAARRLGYRVHTLSPESDTPLGQVADREIVAAYDDLDAIRAFASDVDVVTFEFENVPAATASEAARHAPVRPSGSLLHTTQHRVREKSTLASAGFPVTPFRVVRTETDLRAAIAELGPSGVLKTAGWGYDGKGQVKITSEQQALDAWRSMNCVEAIYEQFVRFSREVSVIAARGIAGDCADFGVIGNVHRHHILYTSAAPAAVSTNIAQRAVEIVRSIMHSWEVVGVLCAEFFMTESGELMINEIAPRPHNSGHLTIDACCTCQFEQQVRAVCGLPLGDATYHSPAAMINLLGDVWCDGTPDWRAVAAMGDAKLHLYGKAQARPGRKMGHITALAPTAELACARVEAALHVLSAKAKT